MIHNGVKRISYWNDSLNPFFKDRPTDNTSDDKATSPSPEQLTFGAAAFVFPKTKTKAKTTEKHKTRTLRARCHSDRPCHSDHPCHIDRLCDSDDKKRKTGIIWKS